MESAVDEAMSSVKDWVTSLMSPSAADDANGGGASGVGGHGGGGAPAASVHASSGPPLLISVLRDEERAVSGAATRTKTAPPPLAIDRTLSCTSSVASSEEAAASCRLSGAQSEDRAVLSGCIKAEQGGWPPTPPPMPPPTAARRAAATAVGQASARSHRLLIMAQMHIARFARGRAVRRASVGRPHCAQDGASHATLAAGRGASTAAWGTPAARHDASLRAGAAWGASADGHSRVAAPGASPRDEVAHDGAAAARYDPVEEIGARCGAHAAAATVLQASWRMASTRRRLSIEAEQQHAALKVQGLYRRRRAMEAWRAALQRHQRDASARSMQAAWHNRLGRRRVSPPPSPPEFTFATPAATPSVATPSVASTDRSSLSPSLALSSATSSLAPSPKVARRSSATSSLAPSPDPNSGGPIAANLAPTSHRLPSSGQPRRETSRSFFRPLGGGQASPRVAPSDADATAQAAPAAAIATQRPTARRGVSPVPLVSFSQATAAVGRLSPTLPDQFKPKMRPPGLTRRLTSTIKRPSLSRASSSKRMSAIDRKALEEEATGAAPPFATPEAYEHGSFNYMQALWTGLERWKRLAAAVGDETGDASPGEGGPDPWLGTRAAEQPLTLQPAGQWIPWHQRLRTLSLTRWYFSMCESPTFWAYFPWAFVLLVNGLANFFCLLYCCKYFAFNEVLMMAWLLISHALP